jgi:DNA repair protein RadC
LQSRTGGSISATLHMLVSKMLVVDGSLFHIMRVCELFRLPLQLNSAAIIVAHNHPSSSVQVSPEDVDVTRILIQAGELLEIEVLDHLIIGQGAWMSMREQRLGW